MDSEETHTALPDHVPSSQDVMNCMEVCGGSGDATRHLRRPGLDVWVQSQSRQDTTAGGGDLHLISSCASGRITRLLMADVCGFGPLFHDLATRLRETMKRNVNSIRQERSVRQMSEQLAAAAREGGFASTVISTYFAPTRSISVCNAGHPPPMLYRSGEREWSLLKSASSNSTASGCALGVVDPGEYQQLTTNLEAGDIVLTYSNSLTESRSPDGRTFGIAGLLDRVQKLDATMPSVMPEQLLQGIRNEHVENLNENDATIMVCQATDTPVAWKDNVLAPFRLLHSVSDRTSFA